MNWYLADFPAVRCKREIFIQVVLPLSRAAGSGLSPHLDDLLQDILIKTHGKLGTLNSQTSLRPWLYQIVSHAIIDSYRRNKSNRSINPDDLWYATIEEDPLPDLEQCVPLFIDALPD